jgi:IS5 family transposase
VPGGACKASQKLPALTEVVPLSLPMRRSAIEPIIGHLKADGHLGRNFLKGMHGDRNNAMLSAIGHNLRLVLRRLRLLLCLILAIVRELFRPRSALMPAS